MDLMLKERRKAQRLPMNRDVKYKILRMGAEAVEHEQFVKAKGHDISEGGIGILTYDKFQPGDILRVDFILDGKEIHAVCEVVWNGHIFLGEESMQYSIGLEFAAMTEEERRYMEAYFKNQFESVWNYLLNPESN